MIQKDEELLFYLETFIKALSIQLDRIEKNYLYDQLQNGDLLVNLSEGSTQLTITQAKELIKYLAKCSYYTEEAYHLHKVCKGHFEERVKVNVPYRNEKHIQKEEQKILEEWKRKEGIRAESVKIKPSVHRNLFFTNRLCDFYIDYAHVDNFKDCSSPCIKKLTVQNLSFETVIRKFEDTIHLYNLNNEGEWGKLAKRIFGENLVLIT